MLRFENFCLSFQAILWIEWDEKHPDKRLAVHFVSGAEPLVFTGPQAVRLQEVFDEMFPDMRANERNAKLPKGFVVKHGPLAPVPIG